MLKEISQAEKTNTLCFHFSVETETRQNRQNSRRLGR